MADQQPAVNIDPQFDEDGRPMLCVTASMGSVVRIAWTLGNGRRVVETDDVHWSLTARMPEVRVVRRG